jgi:hypothetical protein
MAPLIFSIYIEFGGIYEPIVYKSILIWILEIFVICVLSFALAKGHQDCVYTEESVEKLPIYGQTK